MNELMGYSNMDNPYGDANLTEKFRWHKKREAEEKKGISEDEAQARDAARRRETVVELEKLKKRRMEREVEQAQQEQEMVRTCGSLAHASCRSLWLTQHVALRADARTHSNGCSASASAKCMAT
jgi:hypothetical protein